MCLFMITHLHQHFLKAGEKAAEKAALQPTLNHTVIKQKSKRALVGLQKGVS